MEITLKKQTSTGKVPDNVGFPRGMAGVTNPNGIVSDQERAEIKLKKQQR